MDVEQFLRTTSLMELLHANGCGLYGLLGAFIGCWFIPPKGVRDFSLRLACGFIFSFALTPLVGPLAGGFVEKSFGARAAESLYSAPASVGIVIGLIAYYAASLLVVIARNSHREAVEEDKTFLDYKPDDPYYNPPYNPYPGPSPWDNRDPDKDEWSNGPWPNNSSDGVTFRDE